MGKSEKKKRRREKLRLQRLPAGISSLSASLSALLPNEPNESHSDAQRSRPAKTDNTVGNLNQAGPSAMSANKAFYKEKAFGSTASRTRSLPTLSFVYPKDANHAASSLYDFGSSIQTCATLPVPTSSEDVNAGQSNQPGTALDQSIDDILYPKAMSLAPTRSTLQVVQEVQIQRQPQTTPPQHSMSLQVPSKHLIAASLSRRARSNSDLSLRSIDSESGTTRSPYLSGISVEEAARDKAGLRPRANSTDGELKLPRRGLCDERKVLETYQWGKQGISWNVPPKGFNNLGNTCFLNSTLQCLAYCPPFCQSIMSMSSNGNNNSTGYIKQANHGKKITSMLGALFRQLHGNGDTTGSKHVPSGGSRTISPSSIVRAMPSLGSHRSSGYKFRPGRQEDGHEFLVHLLDAMNDGELREAGINAQKSGWRDRLPVPRLDETTFIHRIFGGYFRSQVRCTACGYSSNTYDPFLDLSLEISRNSCHSVAVAISEFTRKETLDSANRWKCSGCKKRVCATKQLTVFRPPLSMCIQLKRFSYAGFGGGFKGQRGGKKISKQIEFPLQLNLPLSDGRSCGYLLTGIVIHVGGTPSSGHYTAYVKRPSKGGVDKWFHLDDSFVQMVSEHDVLRQRDAYMLMYCRKEVIVEFPTPPLRNSMTAAEAQELSRSRARVRYEDVTSTPHVPTTTSEAASNSQPKEDSRETMPLLVSPVDFVTPISSSLPAESSATNDTAEQDCAAKSTLKVKSLSCENNVTNVEPNALQPNIHTSILTSDYVREDASTDKSSQNDGPNHPSKGSLNEKVTRITLDRGECGRVEVMMGPRYKSKKPWQPKSGDGKKDEGFALLGNASVGKWDVSDDENEDSNGNSTRRKGSASLEARSKAVKDIERVNLDRKRRMHLDRYDSLLDQGKTKKIKKNKSPSHHTPVSPQNNLFQRIQESVRILSKSRGKGHIQSLKLKSHKKPGR